MDEEKLAAMNKIMKMLELGKDDNGAHAGERQAANDMAAKLMAKYAIDFSDLRSINPKGHVFENQVVDPLDQVFCSWESQLAGAIARAFDCKIVNSKWPVWTIHFLGTKTDLEIVIFFYRHLRRTICRKSELTFKRKGDQETYAHGMVDTISGRLIDMYTRRNEVMESDCRAMVIVKTDGLQNFVKDQFPSLTKGAPIRLKGSSESYQQGRADGAKVGLNRPISNSGGSAPMRLSRGH